MRQLTIAKQFTNREVLSLDKYMHEIAKIDLIKTNDEIELAKRIRLGDKKALETLIKANLRFVVSVAKQYQNQGLSLPDLINEGNLGLIKAAQKYDETRGFKFISYGVWWIRQSILLALAEQSRMIRIPLNMIGLLTRINKAVIQLEQQYQREPSIGEVAAALKTTSGQVENVIKVSLRHISMDAPVSEETENNLYEFLLNDDSPSPDIGLMNRSLNKEIERSLLILTELEADVIRYYFGISGHQPLSLDEIGKEFGLSAERVRQIKEKSIQKIRNHYRCKLLKTYL